jgi:hypothetical protein
MEASSMVIKRQRGSANTSNQSGIVVGAVVIAAIIGIIVMLGVSWLSVKWRRDVLR